VNTGSLPLDSSTVFGNAIGIVLGVVGAIMRFAVKVHTTGFNIHTAGVILLIVGILAAVVGLVLLLGGSRSRGSMKESVQQTPGVGCGPRIGSNLVQTYRAFDIFVIGGGGTGSEIAFRLGREHGLRVGLAERDKLGGECTHYGCVPTTVMLRSAKIAALGRDAARFGVNIPTVKVDFPAVMDRVRAVIDAESGAGAKPFEDIGVTVFMDAARLNPLRIWPRWPDGSRPRPLHSESGRR
jgi:hypothetical protein